MDELGQNSIELAVPFYMATKEIRFTDADGNVLIPIDALLTAWLPIYANNDLNDFVTVGSYACRLNYYVPSITNKPDGIAHAFRLIVMNLLTAQPTVTSDTWQYFIQILISIDGEIWIRNFFSRNPATSVSFTAWKKVNTSA